MAFFKQLLASKKKPYIPSLEKVEDLTVNLSGATLKLKLPRQHMMGLDGFWCGGSIDIYNREKYSIYSCDLPGVKTGFARVGAFRRDIGLYGKPWQPEVLADISVSALIYRVDGLPGSMNCLSLGDFEKVVNRFMYFEHGPAGLGRKVNGTLAPCNWQVKNLNRVEWVYYESRGNPAVWSDSPEYLNTQYTSHLLTPIDDQYFLVLQFTRNGFIPSAQSNDHLDVLENAITESLELRLSASASKMLIELKNCERDQPFSASREPESWVYFDARKGNNFIGEPKWVIAKEGSPPPNYNVSGL